MDAGPSTPACARMRHALRAEISVGRSKPGEHRTSSALSVRRRVSISPVREALLGREGEGLVEMRQHRGVVAPLPDAAMLADLYDLGGAIRSVLARRTAERRDEAILADMAAANAACFRAAANGDAEAALLHDDAFHDAIDRGADAPQTSAAYRARSAFGNTARLRPGSGPGRMAEAGAQHGRILAAVRAGDAEAAAAAAFAHAMAAKRDLIARFEGGTA